MKFAPPLVIRGIKNFEEEIAGMSDTTYRFADYKECIHKNFYSLFLDPGLRRDDPHF